MNMKSLIALSALTTAGVASAMVASDNTLCRIMVNSGTTNTIVAVPFVKVGLGNVNIPVSELVLTDNLDVGDTLLHRNGTSWDTWEIDVNETSGAKYWKPTLTSENSETNQADPAEDTALARGDSIWVVRASAAKPFYIYGQITNATATAATSTAVKGSATVPAYTMMSAPTTDPAGFQLSTLVGKKSAGAFADGDTIVVVDPSNTTFGRKEYVYKSDQEAFCTLTVTTSEITIAGTKYTAVTGQTWTPVAATVKIPAGEGFWYVSKGGDPTFTW